jgi:segregation and condensation protein B
MSLEARLEAVLFYKAEPLSRDFLIKTLGASAEEIEVAIVTLAHTLETRGLALTMTDTHVELVTSPDLASLIEDLRKEELKGEIGKAGAETLAIILYRGPLSRSEIDKIRGVNSNFILRNLLIRGLIERRPHPTDSRSFVYASTPALLNHLGVDKKESLPDWVEVSNALDAFDLEEQEREEKEADATLTETS